jgi:hypothetical protein
MEGVSWLTEDLSDCQEGLCSMEWLLHDWDCSRKTCWGKVIVLKGRVIAVRWMQLHNGHLHSLYLRNYIKVIKLRGMALNGHAVRRPKRRGEKDGQCTCDIPLWGVREMFRYLLGYPKSLIPFHSKRVLLWRFTVAGNNKTYLGLHVVPGIYTRF